MCILKAESRGKRTRIVVVMIFLVLLVSIPDTLPSGSINSENTAQESRTDADDIDSSSVHYPETGFTNADDSVSGFLDPITVEQIGYAASGNQTVRTDTDSLTQFDFQIDEEHDWIASKAELSLQNLTTLYVLNGTFESGLLGTNMYPNGTLNNYPNGWGASSTNTAPVSPEQVQFANYEESYDGRKYISVENQGVHNHPSKDLYLHYAGTNILWNQSISITPYSEDFVLSFEYIYVRGPLGTGFTGDCSLVVYADGSELWSISLPSLSSRGLWISTGPIPLNISTLGDSAMFEIGLVIDTTLDLDGEQDYDGDSFADGELNTRYITAYLDEISFTSANAPTCASVDLQFTAGNETVPIDGSSGTGSAAIINESYWRGNVLSTEITSNTSISFMYETRLLSHRFINSTWTTDNLEPGVMYNAQLDDSPELSCYAYLGFLGTYEEPRMKLWHPIDWENGTVLDPFLADVTVQCNLLQNVTEIPEHLMSRLGWWKFLFESPNYSETLVVQKQDELSSTWFTDTVFRSSNRTRASLTLGANGWTPNPTQNVNFTWFLPNGTIWFNEDSISGINGIVNGTARTLGPMNTTAGLWTLRVIWQNSTEVAFDQVQFEVHHSSSLIVPGSGILEIESGLVITSFLNYIDAENGEFLMEPVATITGNWSLSTITFDPNDVRNQWEADLNTSLVGAGEFIVVVNATRQYYDNASCTFIVRSTKIDNNLTLDDTTKSMNLFELYIAGFHFEDAQGTEINDANVSVDVVSGPAEGLTSDNGTYLGMGNYAIEFYSLKSGTYEVTVTAWKDYHEADDDTLIITVGALASNLTLVNGSVEAIQFGENYTLFVQFTNGTGMGLSDGIVSVETVAPEIGLNVQPTVNEGLGYYSILLNPNESNTYTVLVKAAKENHQTQFVTFTLTVTNISASISLNYTNAVIPFDGSCIVHLNLTSSLYGGLAGATVSLSNPPPGFIIVGPEDLTGGIYRFTITPGSTGPFLLSFIASAPNHNEVATSFTLEVTLATTNLLNPDGLSSDSTEFMSTYQLFVLFERPDTSSNVSDADIDVTFSSLETLEWSVSAQADGYMLSIYADELGRWDLTIAASKDNHQDDTLRFILYVNEIETRVEGTGPVDAFYYGRSYSFTYNYIINGNLTGILGASIDKSGTGSDWLTLVSLGSGQYNITVIPQDTGSFGVDVTFGRYGFQDQTIAFSFLVRAIPITVQVEPPTWTEGHPLQLIVTLTDDLGSPVTGAEVLYELYRGLTSIHTGVMDEGAGGIYTVSVAIQPDLAQSYDVYFAINKDNHAPTESSYQSAIVLIETQEGLLGRLWLAYGIPAVGAIAAIGIVGASYRVRSKRRAAYMTKALAVKKRFDDANNFIGIVILHKTSGLPIYSNVLKGGFEEGMISAFITAITHFRSEFDGVGENLTFEVLPISDIIRAVPTRNLVCAFITVSSASMQMEEKMVDFSKAVSKILDDESDERPTLVNNGDLAPLLERYFEEAMDGFLLRYYKRGVAGTFPRRYRCLEESLEFTEAADCARPVFIAKNVTNHCKITEAESCLLVLEAIEKELLVPCARHEILSFASAHFDDSDRHLPDGPVTM